MRTLGTGKLWWGCLLSLACLALLPLEGQNRADAASAEVAEFDLPPGNFYPRAIAAGADGNVWVSVTRGQVGRIAPKQRYEGLIDRVAPSGQITEFPAPAPYLSALSSGVGGNVWYLSSDQVGFISSSGQLMGFPLSRPFSEGGLAAGSDGNMWTTERNDSGTDTIARIAPDGQVIRFPLPTRESGPGDITAGPDGALWFTELFNKRIGRITTGGQIAEFSVTAKPFGITAGPDGNLWFTYEGGIGRISPTGQVKEFPVRRRPSSSIFDGMGGPITSGPDGRLWFTQGPGVLGRISPRGRISYVDLPLAQSFPTDLVTGPDGTLWYSALGDHPCEGGGGTCQAYLPDRAGLVGRVVPGSLEAMIDNRHSSIRGRRAEVRIRCAEGKADSVCKGRIRVSARGIVFAAGRYRMPTDARRAVGLRLRPKGLELLDRHRRLWATATVTLAGGERQSRSIKLAQPKSKSAR